MAVTRAFLKGMGLSEEQVSAIIEEHTNTVSGLKESRDQYKEDSERLADVQKELDDLKANNGDAWKSKYEDLKKTFDDFKTEVSNRQQKEKVKTAYAELLRESKVDDKRIDAILRITDMGDFKLDEAGRLKDEDALKESIKKDWSAFIQTTEVKPAQVDTPPTQNKIAKTKAEIYAKDEFGHYKLSTSERQKALSENPDLLR